MPRYHLQPQQTRVRALALDSPSALEFERHDGGEVEGQQVRMGVEI